MTGTGVLVSSCLIQPVGSRFGGLWLSACFHTHSCRLADFTLSTNFSVVGGSAAIYGAHAADFPTFIL